MTMKRELKLLTTILIVFISCKQRVETDNNKSIDSTMTKDKEFTRKDFNTVKVGLSDKDLGLGLVSINFDDKTILHFFSSANDKVPKRSIQFFNDPKIDSWNIRNLDKQKEWLKPEVLWLDYSSFVFRCLEIKDDWLKVMVNNENGETLWLKKSELTIIQDWENYLKEMFGVERLPDQQQKIRSLPNDTSKETIYQGKDCFQVTSMKGDWIEIFTADYCDESYTDSKTRIKSGWIKWRQGNKLLIDYFTTS
jgi:hypothetical protein